MHTPFGPPDASSDARSQLSDFVVLPRLAAHVLMSAKKGDEDARVVVGRTGAGRTRHLLELRNRLKADGSCDLTEPDFGPPSLAYVTRVAEGIEVGDVAERVEIWRRVWKRAIVRSTISQLLAQDRGGEGRELQAALRKHDRGLLGSMATPRPISVEFDSILKEHQTIGDLRQFLDHADWREIEDAVDSALSKRDRPLCFFLDIVEEDAAQAPLHWLRCMKGLLRQVLRFLRVPLGEDKLRLYVAVREQAWIEVRDAALISVDHHPAVRVLQWDAPILLEFFAEKISSLPDDYRLATIDLEAPPGQVVSSWLGTDTIPNAVRTSRGSRDPVSENLTEYVLRHTRLIPRDVIVVGNCLAAKVYAAREREAGSVAPADIHAAVADSARTLASEELQWCALEIVADLLADANTRARRDQIVPDEDAATRIAGSLSALLKSCSADVISEKELDELEDDAEETFRKRVDLGSLLWRHGLLGWGADIDGPFRFAYDFGPPGRNAPQPEGTYVAMHPILIDALGVSAASPTPVCPFQEEL